MSINPAFPRAVNSRIQLFLLIVVLAPFPAIGRSQEYTVTNLGTLGGPTSRAAAVNDNGEVVGTADVTANTGTGDAFLYANGAMTDLAPGNSALGSAAVAINDQEHIVVNLNTENFDIESYLWNGTNLIDLGTGDAVSMNANDMIVGNIENSRGWYWVYANGQLDTSPTNPLPSPWVDAIAMSVNSSGEIAGLCSDGDIYDQGPACVFGQKARMSSKTRLQQAMYLS